MMLKIKDLEELKNGEKVQFDALLSDKRTGWKKDGSPYLLIIIQDSTSTLAFPIWDNYDKYNGTMEVNTVIRVSGIVNRYNGSIQIRNPIIENINEDIDYSEFVPVYYIPEELIEYFNTVVNNLEEKYKKIAIGATGAFNYNEERWNAFTNCVAAEKFHGNKRGGLFLHTVGVMKSIDDIIKNYITTPFYMSAKGVINKDRLMLKAIVHDIMKTKEYDYKGIIRRKEIKLDHLVLGAAYVREINNEMGNPIGEEELDDICYSILAHHGEFGNFQPKGIEDILLNVADIIDSQVVNAIENKI